LPKRTRNIVLLLIALATYTIASTAVISLIVGRSHAPARATAENIIWGSSHFQSEFYKLEARVASAIALPSDDAYREVGRRFDILLNRISVMGKGQFRAAYDGRADVAAAVQGLSSRFLRLDPTVQLAKGGDRLALLRLDRDLSDLEAPVAALTADVGRLGGEAFHKLQESVIQQAYALGGLFIGQIVTFALLSLVVGRQMRDLGKVGESLAAANANLSRSEADAKRARQQLADAINALADPFALYDADDRLLLCNESYSRDIVGGPVGAVPGTAFAEILRARVQAGRIPAAIGREEAWIAARMEQRATLSAPSEQFSDGRWYRISERRTSDGSIVSTLTDVTEIKAREESLREQQLVLRSVLDHIPVTVTMTDAEHRFVLLNREAEKRLQIRAETAIGRRVDDAVPARLRSPTSAEDNEAVLATGKPIIDREYTVPGEDGEERWIVTRVPIFDDSGKIKYVLRTGTIVPQLAQAYRRLEQSRAQLQDAQRRAKLAYWTWDAADGWESVWSEEAASIFGTAPDPVPTDDEAFRRLIREEDRAGAVEAHRGIYYEGRNYAIEYRVPRRDGRTVWIRETGEVLDVDADRKPTRMIGTIQDITEQKRIEQDLRESRELLLDAQRRAKLAYWIWDIREDRLRWSEGATEMIGVPDERLPKNDADSLAYIHPDDRQRVATVYERAGRDFQPYELDYRVIPGDGRMIWVKELAETLRDASGAPLRMLGTVQDITEQKHNEEALRESESRLRAFMDHAPAIMYVKDAQGRYQLVNRQFERVEGITAEEARGRTLADLRPRQSRPTLAEQDLEVLEHGRVSVREISGHGDTAFQHTLVVKFPIRDAAGEIVGIGCYAQDITEQKSAEQALLASQARLKGFLDNAPLMMYVKDGEGRYDLVNREFERVEGVAAAAVIGHTASEIYGITDAEYVIGHDREVLDKGTAVAREYSEDVGRGSRDYLVIKFPIRDADGNIVGIGGCTQDISELKNTDRALRESEARLRQAQQRAKLAHWRWTPGADRYEWSPGAEAILRRSPDEIPLTEADYLELLHPDDRKRVAQLYAETTDRPGAYAIDYRIRGRGGETVWIRELAEAVADDQGRILYGMGTVQDVTEQKLLQEQLSQAQKMEAVGQLTGGIAHDFNNLLAVILGNLELMQARPDLNPAVAKRIDTAIRTTLRGADLTHRLLAFGRRQPLAPKSTNVNELVRGVQELIRRPLGPSFDIAVIEAADLWLTEVDQAQLENAILNLSLNARDAMPQGGQLTIETANVAIDESQVLAERDLKPGDYVAIAVSDTGHGMAPEVMARAFEPFFTTKGIGKGSGLGLSMVYGFVKQSGGHVKLYSEAGRGTTVKLLLPRLNAAQAAGTAATAEESAGRGETILVVDDEADLRELACNHLESLGYRVVAAGDGAEALAAMEHNRGIDLLLTDVILPGNLDGRGIAREARARRPGLKVLYMSGYAPQAAARSGQIDEPDLHISKPFRKSDLSRKLREVLDGGDNTGALTP
jgi:PAS domain S-box-containing protein